jgi:ferrous iron transport protein A
MTLDQLECGEEAWIASIDGGFGIRRHLEALGLYPGDRVKMIQAGAFRGPVLVEARGARLAIGRGVARRVLVQDLGAMGREDRG